MKFVIALTALLATVANASKVAAAATEISVDSAMGANVLSHARRLDDGEDEDAYAWVAGYAIKFQGCHSIKQWNDEADDEEDVRISTKSLIRFRLCPVDSCSATKAAGCTAGYGDYVIDMATFMDSYFEAVRQNTEYQCAYFLANSCNCEDGDDQADDFNEEYCEYDCYNDAMMYECIDRNPYNDDEQDEDQFEIEEYMECVQLDIQDDERRRRMEEGEEEEIQYFVGPYCGSQGGSIHLGLFTDDTCTTAASSEISFEDLMGFTLPYQTKSIVSADCVGCLEPVEDEDNNDNDNADADAVLEACEQIYTTSGKCETNLPSGMTTINEAACNYMEGIRIVRQDGIIDTGSSRPSAVATAFIVISAMAFAAMAFYVWYLRTRLGVKKNTLL